jgi:hypothetical protein
MLINSSLTGNGACYFIYEPLANTIDTANDAGTAVAARATPGSSATVSNSQCGIPASGVSVVAAGGTVTVTLTVNFAASFTGAKTVWAAWYNAAGQFSGWQQVGTWSIATNQGPLSVSPSAGAGRSQQFTYTFTGLANPGSLNMLINSSLTGNGACYFIYEPLSNMIDIANDAGTAVSNRMKPGTTGTLVGSQCSIAASSVTVNNSGSTITVSLTVNFAPSFAGAKTSWAAWYDASGQFMGWQPVGSWTAQ